MKTLPPWPLRGRARTKNLLKATQRRAPTGGRDFRNCPALANKTIAEGTPIRQYRANHDFGVPRTRWSIHLLYAACRPDSVTQSRKRATREVAVCTTISTPVFCHTHYVTEPQTTRVRRGAAWDDMQQTTRDGVDQINVATNSPANFSRWHPALTGAGWTALNCTGLQCTPLGMTAAAGGMTTKRGVEARLADSGKVLA